MSISIRRVYVKHSYFPPMLERATSRLLFFFVDNTKYLYNLPRKGEKYIMTKKNKWEIERDKLVVLRKKAMKSLTPEQLSTIKKVHITLDTVLHNIREIDDIYLTDIKEMDNCLWQLKSEFNLEKD